MRQVDALVDEAPLPRSFLRDLVAISSLPEVWTHRSPTEIAAGLAGILCNTLYLDVAYVALLTQSGGAEIKAAHTKSGKLSGYQVREIGAKLEETLLRLDAQDFPVTIPHPLGDGSLQAVVMPVGITGVHGYFVAASKQPGFPDEFQHLLLRIAANHAAVILRQKQAEEELTDFFENATEGLHWVGPDGIVLWANQAELDMLGYTRDEYIGQPFEKFHADPVVAEDIIQRLIHGQPVTDYEARLRCKDGSVKHVLINSSVYRKNGEFVHTRCFTRDITERKRMEDTLRRAYDEVEMRVEFRTKELLAAIEALKEEIASRQQVEAEVSELRSRLAEGREAERLLLAQELHDGPIQDLFALSYGLNSQPEGPQIARLKSVQDEIRKVVGTLRQLCEELRPSDLISHGLEKAIQSHLEQFKEQNPTYTVQFELAQEGKLPERLGLALYRIYQQALANVIRHAQANQILVRLQIEEDQAVLEVRDNGRGFAVPTTWLEFARQGHLGLIGNLERAEAVGGKLTVESAPGKGTLVQAKVPIKSQTKP